MLVGHGPREGSVQMRKAGLWVCKDHSGCLVACRLKEGRAGCRDAGGASDMGR